AQTRLGQFRPGERLSYSVSFGKLHAGSGEMSVSGVETTDGHAMWRAILTISGGIPLFRVRDTTMSWFDTGTYLSRRFVQYVNEGRYHVRRDFRIDPEGRTYQKNKEPITASSADPLDDISMLYFARTLPLADGDRYELNRYFQPEGNPVVLRVVRRERVTVPAGTFPAIVVEPQIVTSGIFSRGGQALLWFSDDSSRVLLQMKAGLTFGSINLYLTHATR
ncbi:MAG TPA: DUF3108 domain-containing protein, partial [Gemmatimonadaceae bacterium]